MPMSSRKLVKVAKKLKKLWPAGIKTRKKQPLLKPPPPLHLPLPVLPPPQLEYYHLPPPPYDFHFTCSSSASFQPSAPPLPPWLDLEEPEPDQINKADDESLLLLSNSNTTSPSSYHMSLSSSYQQYTVPSPVYGVPVAQQQPIGRPGRRRGGFFDRIVGFVVTLFGCVCPCLRITEPR